jgi:hypothetical protein
MRGGILIHFDNYDILKSNISTLKETSIDNHDKNNICYMTDSEIEAVNFDDVKRAYIKGLSLSEEPKSNDALFINRNNNLVFVEFKNGFMDAPKKYAVRKKIYDSIIILTDIMNMGVSQLRNNMEYILVYNEDINKNEREVLEKKKSFVQSSSAYDDIAKSLCNLAKTEYVCFGVKIFENYCFHKVHTYTEAEFEKYLENN